MPSLRSAGCLAGCSEVRGIAADAETMCLLGPRPIGRNRQAPGAQTTVYDVSNIFRVVPPTTDCLWRVGVGPAAIGDRGGVDLAKKRAAPRGCPA
jgi:hypothetical protein